MASWRVALALQSFIHQCDTAWPDRSKVSDGTIGDTRHQHEQSDHNPNPAGVVTAFDLTEDPKGGPDCAVVAEQLRVDKDRRIKYVIWNRRIFSSYVSGGIPAWAWRPYTGSDPHTNHLHLSVSSLSHFYDDANPWQLPCFGLGDGDMAELLVPTSDNNPHHKPGTMLPLAQYLQELSHEIFAIRSIVVQDLTVDKSK